MSAGRSSGRAWQAHYRAIADPIAYADIVVDNNDPSAPKLVAER
ncbi:hypothetical protein [Kibdelosporangium philippinense]|nr:hypothetical protein [Kibdelosporangium philippinense]